MSKSLIGRLPRKARQIGPVAGVSFRVASRMANSLRAGYPVRSADELDSASAILFHAPADRVRAMAELLESARIDWTDKPLIVCDCEAPAGMLNRLRAKGASTAVAREFGIAGAIMVEGSAPALARAHRMASELRLSAIEIAPGCGDVFAAALTMGTAALTPLVNRAAGLLCAAGLRKQDAVRIAAALFEQTVQEYGRSGKQSWAWHIHAPDAEQIAAEIAAVIAAVDDPFGELFRRLIVSGFEDFEKHAELARVLRSAGSGPCKLEE